jgi:dsDNA-binding SOS-regulon protein
MPDWDAIMDEAERLAELLQQKQIDLSEAEKLLGYFVYKNYDPAAVSRYLDIMSKNPPPRSKRSQSLKEIWSGWRTDLAGADKARAWGWAVRIARTKGEKKGSTK